MPCEKNDVEIQSSKKHSLQETEPPEDLVNSEQAPVHGDNKNLDSEANLSASTAAEPHSNEVECNAVGREVVHKATSVEKSKETNGVGRRLVLQSSALASAMGVASLALPGGAPSASATASKSTNVKAFQHGVASGDPLPNAVIIWTRVTPTRASRPGARRGSETLVGWEVATIGADGDWGKVVSSGEFKTHRDRDFTVKVDAQGLSPATRYKYRFTVLDGPAEGSVSPTGTTQTAPAIDADIDRQRFAVVSCSNWEAGYYASYRFLADRGDLDFVVHLGDWLYEYATGVYSGKTGPVRKHAPRHEITTLADYRIRHAKTRTDPDLVRIMRQVPFITTWDDHESADNSYKGGAENHDPGEGSWAKRRAASAKAYFEWMPVRPNSLKGDHLYRRLRFGKLMELSILDLRSYRDKQSYLGGHVDSSRRTIAGNTQLEWLRQGIVSSNATWKLVGNPVMITPVKIPPIDSKTTKGLLTLLGLPATGPIYNSDQWDGYQADRDRIFRTLHEQKVKDTVFLTGDIHSTWATELPLRADKPFDDIVGVELVPPSITASNIDDMLHLPEGNPLSATAQTALMTMNRHIKWIDLDRHGYGLIEVTKDYVQMDVYYLTDKTSKRTRQYLGGSFRTVKGSSKLKSTSKRISSDRRKPFM